MVREVIDPAFTRKFLKKGGRVERMRGEWALCLVRKRERTTESLVRKLAHSLKIPVHAIGYAGLKDKHAVTSQFMTLKNVNKVAIENVKLPGVKIAFEQYINRPLETGNLLGNEFRIRLRGRKKLPLERVVDGFPNYYGPQRFGSQGTNHLTGKRILLIGKSSFPKKRTKFFLQAYQSHLFNKALEQYAGPPLFRDVGIIGFDQKVATSPLEKAIHSFAKKDKISPENFRLNRLKITCTGTRRRAFVKPLHLRWKPPLLTFFLPKGSYATALLQEVLHG